MDKPRPFKLMLNSDLAKTLDHIAADLKSEEGNYQIGVGTVAARLLESLADHPELIQKLLAEYSSRYESPKESASAPKAKTHRA